MSKERIIIALGFVFILVFASKIPYLFQHPFKLHEGLKALSQEAVQAPEFMKEAVGINGLSAIEIEKQLSREFKINWVILLITIILGCLSGYSITRKKNYGRLMALGLSSFLLGHRLINLFGSEHWPERLSLKMYALRFKHFPFLTIQEEVTYLVLLVTIVILLHPSIAKEFKPNQKIRSNHSIAVDLR